MTPRRRGGLGALAASADHRSRVETAAGARREQLREVAPADLAPSPWQPRDALNRAELETLVDSIREHGVLEPLLARVLDGGGLELVAGHRRLAAAKLAELETVPVRLLELSDLQAQAANLTENLARSDLSPYETAKAIAALQDVLEAAGEVHTIERLAQLTGRSTGGVSMALKTARNLSEPVVTASGVSADELRAIGTRALYTVARQQKENRVHSLQYVARKVKAGDPQLKAAREAEAPFEPRPPAPAYRISNYLESDDTRGTRFEFALRTPADGLDPKQAREILEQLQPLLDALKKRAKQ